MNQFTLRIVDGEVSHPLMRLNKSLNFEFGPAEHIAIIGPNGAGKTLLVATLLGKYPLRKGKLTYDFSPSASTAVYENMQYLEFRDGYGVADSTYYYQQRWNSWDTDDFPTVREFLDLDLEKDSAAMQEIVESFNLRDLFPKKMVFLSSGELRKVQLARTLFKQPRILILDNPLIGLDHNTRILFLELLDKLSQQPDLQIILVIPTGEILPQFITHVLPVDQKIVQKKLPREEYEKIDAAQMILNQKELKKLSSALDFKLNAVSSPSKTSSEIVRLNKVNLGYDGVQLLKQLTWTVRRGEKWKLTGENGTGKSALLSLIYADNPQSYAQDIHLFGRKRGTGESIWEIKSRIGYLSPEMHRSYLKNLPVIEIVASGLHDSLGLYKKTTEAEQAACLFWMRLLQMEHLKERSFLQISSGEQRLALLARAFVKNPELLILDEPFHGLDVYHCQRVKLLIESFCSQPDKTLIMVTHYEEDFPKIMTHALHLEKNNIYLISEL